MTTKPDTFPVDLSELEVLSIIAAMTAQGLMTDALAQRLNLAKAVFKARHAEAAEAAANGGR